VELFEQLRREYEFGIGTIKGVARKFGVHRRLVRQAVNSALPPVRTYRHRSRPVLGAVEGFIDGILEADRQAPRKQRHTARRIYRRILAEMPGHRVAESTVRNYVHDRKRALGLLIQETYVAQSYQGAFKQTTRKSHRLESNPITRNAFRRIPVSRSQLVGSGRFLGPARPTESSIFSSEKSYSP
jgi:hypothetical protein